ncbi:MAG: prenyltransferase [Thermoproteota archaeon]|nr:prenyltransferase [Thermoproteota archaeon]
MANQKLLRYLAIWSRAIRVRFLLASVIAAANGIAISIWKNNPFDPVYAILTICGVVCLHTSVDLLNDYWDYKRGIDTITTRTKFSGGTGVLPEKLLTPKMVYVTGILFLILGTIIGIYFVTVRGIVILLILIFATLSIYFYSTNIVNAGLAEVFVTVKGAMIVVGSFYVQAGRIDPTAVFVGIIIGLLSACVLLITSFPDYDADKNKGRRTLSVILGKDRASKVLPLIMTLIYSMIVLGVSIKITPSYTLISLLSIPICLRAVIKLIKNYDNQNELVLSMADTVLCSRIVGAVTAASFLL